MNKDIVQASLCWKFSEKVLFVLLKSWNTKYTPQPQYVSISD